MVTSCKWFNRLVRDRKKNNHVITFEPINYEHDQYEEGQIIT